MQGPAKAISILFHPIVLPSLGIFLLFQSGSWLGSLNARATLYIYAVTLSSTFLLPLLVQGLFKPPKRIGLLLYAFFTLIGAFILQQVSAPILFPLLLNGFSIVVLISALIQTRWNISLHMIGMGALVGLFLALTFKWMLDLRWILMVLFVVTGISATAQLQLGKHRSIDVYGGALYGFILIYLLVRFI